MTGKTITAETQGFAPVARERGVFAAMDHHLSVEGLGFRV